MRQLTRVSLSIHDLSHEHRSKRIRTRVSIGQDPSVVMGTHTISYAMACTKESHGFVF